MFSGFHAARLTNDYPKERSLNDVTTFAASGYALNDLHILRDLHDLGIGELLADCPVIRVAAGQTP